MPFDNPRNKSGGRTQLEGDAHAEPFARADGLAEPFADALAEAQRVHLGPMALAEAR